MKKLQIIDIIRIKYTYKDTQKSQTLKHHIMSKNLVNLLEDQLSCLNFCKAAYVESFMFTTFFVHKEYINTKYRKSTLKN
jgi:hypothetical protein